MTEETVNNQPSPQPPPKARKDFLLGTIVGALLTCLLVFGVFDRGGGSLMPKPFFPTSVSQDLSDKDFDELRQVYNSINHYYIEEVSKDQLLEGAAKGMVKALGDPHSEYLNAQESRGLDDSVSGSFEGVGIQISREGDRIIVISPIDNTPADRAGIQPHDVILEADGIDLIGMDTSEVVEYIRGPKGSSVSLKIQRGHSTFEVTLEREEIPLITVESDYQEEDQVGIIRISQFASTTYDELVEEIQAVKEQGAQQLVFDLRMNPGGLLDQALKISNIFLEEGQPIMSVEDPEEKETFVADNQEYGDYKIDLPFAILINEGSASASEIIAALVQEETDGKVIGQTSFGKGTVQSILNSSEKGELKLTIAKWLTPQGHWINEEGVVPDLEVEQDELSNAILLNPEETVQLEDTNDYVETISKLLFNLDYEVTPRSYFDEVLEEAVKKFQKDHDLPVTGTVEGETAQAINQAARDYLDTNDRQLEAAIQSLKD